MLTQSIQYLHTTALALWFGGLFGYVLIVWPSIMQSHRAEFPRALLCTIAVRTGPWIYLAMVLALLTAVIYLLAGASAYAIEYKLAYLLLLGVLVANNLYGSAIAWPKMMLSPDNSARLAWRWFYLRMVVSLVFGLLLLSVAIIAT